ncbi:MAG TPA: membrane protein insertase YidC, partial [Planctomycetes bacterium]|nr:membrane protein insertase YidC [Planctomycetota bacterium]
QPFILWIKDLSMPDMLLRLQEGAVGWADKLIPDYLNVLPILMTLLWWLQQKLMPKSDDPQQKQMQVMMQFMPILFGFMLYNYASGLALYMTVSSLFGIFEARLIKKKVQELSQAESLAPARK